MVGDAYGPSGPYAERSGTPGHEAIGRRGGRVMPETILDLGIFRVERVTRSELALSAWEAARHGRWGRLTSQFGVPAGDRH